MQKKNIYIFITTLIIILLISIGISFAFFSANLTGIEDSTTITASGGTMNIFYDSGPKLTATDIVPSDRSFVIKEFKVTGNNTTLLDMMYQINLVITSNTFSNDALKYKLYSTNTSNNGQEVPITNEFINIGAGSNTINLGVGYFSSPTDGDKTHTYILELFFLNQEYNQIEDLGKEINAYIEIKNYEPPLLGEEILAQGGGKAAIEAKGNPNFSKIATFLDTGLYAAEDEYGISYYYRGEKNLLNNNLLWGGFQWKIVRINGDGSIRLIYNGTHSDFIENIIMNDEGRKTRISYEVWNLTNSNDAKYVGYMYGGVNGVASTIRNGTTSLAATYNETDSYAKYLLDNWYIENIRNKPAESEVVDNLFCNDRQLQNEVGGPATGPGYGNTGEFTVYGAYHRLRSEKLPTLKCGLKNDRFTVSDNAKGNGNLTYPIGLLTADEATYAGLAYGIGNISNYLFNDETSWLFSPYNMASDSIAFLWFMSISGKIDYYYVNQESGYRPVVSISGDVRVTGTGSATNPFVIKN